MRIIAATNRALMAEMESGRFRPDLFYRLSVVSLEVPPLRERSEDIPGLIERHVEQFRIAMNRSVESVGEDALELLVAYRWPGNIRELVNVVERAVLLCETDQIRPSDLPEEIRTGARQGASDAALDRRPDEPVSNAGETPSTDVPYRAARQELLDVFEQRYIQALLKRSNGRIRDAARIAGLNSRSVYEIMKKHGIRKEFYKV